MCANVHNPTLINNNDLLGSLNRRQAMRHDKDCAAYNSFLYGLLYQVLGLRIGVPSR